MYILMWYKITIKGEICSHCSLSSMTMTYSGKPSYDVVVLLMPDATVSMNAASNLWQFRVGASKVEVPLYSKMMSKV